MPDLLSVPRAPDGIQAPVVISPLCLLLPPDRLPASLPPSLPPALPPLPPVARFRNIWWFTCSTHHLADALQAVALRAPLQFVPQKHGDTEITRRTGRISVFKTTIDNKKKEKKKNNSCAQRFGAFSLESANFVTLGHYNGRQQVVKGWS